MQGVEKRTIGTMARVRARERQRDLLHTHARFLSKAQINGTHWSTNGSGRSTLAPSFF